MIFLNLGEGWILIAQANHPTQILRFSLAKNGKPRFLILLTIGWLK